MAVRENPPSPFERPRLVAVDGERRDDPELETGGADELLADLDQALADDHPLALLALASTMTEALAPSRDAVLERILPQSDTDRERSELPGLPDLLSMFIESGQQQTQALAYAISRLQDDELLRTRVDRRLGPAMDRLPGWLQELDRAEPIATLQALDPVLAGVNLAIGVRFATGQQITVVGFVDLDLGGPLTDAFVLDVAAEEYLAKWEEFAAEAEQLPIAPADLRARLEAALDITDHTVPPYETDSWPQCRALLHWAIRMLPEGGEEFADRAPSDREIESMVTGFLNSAEAGELADDPDTGPLADALLDNRSPYNDPLLWSTKAVQIFLGEFAVERFMAPTDFLIKFADVLPALIRYGHRVRGVSQGLTDDALRAVREITPQFRAEIQRRRTGTAMSARGIAELLAAQGLNQFDFDLGDRFADGSDFHARIADSMINNLAIKVGGEELLEEVDVVALPDEPLSLDGIDETIADRVLEAGQHIDEACNALLEQEMRTAARRILHDVAVNDPTIFSRRGRMDTAAAAICWITLINNCGNPMLHQTQIPIKELRNHFGGGTPSQRAKPMLEALGLPPSQGSPFDLGDLRYLTSSTRREIVQARERYSARRSGR
ncbi:hypothetical protein FOE78_02115 [Microlunatus elymi]|uniref:DUF6398 domain-containing protein n=1 Tax=Microlunatus elymi TaxID=2596828 RepID=A0A516PUN9_9ACTN|nr:DUF6398 domain-containing protein [Microlunatus elymi]QDP94872.1 hypothetical protein FOE78_02115 [Microlunatus elymi]